jgi:Dolichyl-phosphate-mannose-protein mannosyltransferase
MHILQPLVSRIAHRPLTTVFFLALAVRLVNIALLKGDSSFFAETDALGYWALGAALAKRDTFWPILLQLTDHMPLYPLLLAAFQSTLGDKPRLVALIQALIDSGTCVLIAALGALVSPLVGFVAGILAAFSLTLIVTSSQILTETFFLFFFTLMLLMAGRFILCPTKSLAVLAGLSGGIALATRPAIALLLIAAVPVAFIVVLVRRDIVHALATCALFVLAAAGPIAPVLARNVVYYDSWSLTSQGAEHLALWIVPLVQQRADGTPYHMTVEHIENLYQQRLAKRSLSGETNPFRLAAIKSEVAREEMAQLPFSAYVEAWLEGMLVNLSAPALLVDPRVRALPKPSLYNTPGVTLWEKTHAYVFEHLGLYQILLLVGLASMLPFLVLEVIGFIILARILPWAAVLGGGVLAYFLLINGPVAAPKYRLPMEPVLIILCALSLARWLHPKGVGRDSRGFLFEQRTAHRNTVLPLR